ncbi:unnamed protein product [Symbiodinium necroappetens]|uniref:Uncharacterized protein n=1 Tax=Symbiodinium necroappetens TaxID=1628268 RepID=A0A812NSX7_9DINO|nr:unnamed protein product [Symbiodinium necroappetens]
MFFTLCRDLHDLFQKDDLELSFSPNDAEGNLSRREPAACKYRGYDPVADDYEMITMPAEPGNCDAEKKMIQRQIASLSSRIARGGAPEVLDHYQKVKEDLELQLAKPGILRYKTMDVPDVDLRSTLSTISTCDTFPDEPTCIPLDLEPAGVQPSSKCQLLAAWDLGHAKSVDRRQPLWWRALTNDTPVESKPRGVQAVKRIPEVTSLDSFQAELPTRNPETPNPQIELMVAAIVVERLMEKFGTDYLVTVGRSHRLGQVASGICLNFVAMFFTLCQELHELFQEDDLELSFSDHGAEDDFSHRRHLAACKNSDYDPDADDYEMISMPAEPEDGDAEKKTIQRQIASLSSRIAAGGAPEVLDHYHKVKEGLAKELAMRGILRHKTMDVPDVDLLSTLSTISTCDTYPDEHTFIPLELERAKFNVPASGIVGPRARRLSGKEASTVVEGSGQ